MISPWLNRHSSTVMLMLLAVSAYSAFSGFVSLDSWSYLHLAQSVRHGEGCKIGGEYLAVYPCGYPILIAALAPFSDLTTLVVTSKLANLLLSCGSFLLLGRVFGNLLVPTLIAFNPVSMRFLEWTWSENLFLFAVCGVFACVAAVAQAETVRIRSVVLLGVFLVLGCLSRYAFGPFAAILFVVTWIVHGRRVAWSVLPAFVVAAAVYLGYQILNLSWSGFATGQARLPAPESLSLLGVVFGLGVVNDLLLGATGALALFLAGQSGPWFGNARNAASSAPMQCESARRAILFLALAGVGYLALVFGTRAVTHFDLFGPRLIGLGNVFVLAALAGHLLSTTRAGAGSSHTAISNAPPTVPLRAVLAAGVAGFVLSHVTLLPRPGIELPGSPLHRMWPQALATYGAPEHGYRTIVSFGVPPVSPLVAGWPGLWYGDAVEVLGARSLPYSTPESLDGFRRRVQAAAAPCAFDFTGFSDVQAFGSMLRRPYPVGLEWAGGSGESGWFRWPGLIAKPRFDPALVDWFVGVFEPGRFVPCERGAGS